MCISSLWCVIVIVDEEKTVMVQLSLERDFDPALNDSRSPGFKEYSDKIASSVRYLYFILVYKSFFWKVM